MKQETNKNHDRIIVLISAGERLCELRKRRGLDPKTLAKELDLSLGSYLGLEDFDEVYFHLSLAKLFKLCILLETTPLTLCGMPDEIRSEELISQHAFAQKLQSELRENNRTTEEFAEAVGWEISTIIKNPAAVLDFTFEAIRIICEATLSIPWMATVEGLYREYLGSPDRNAREV